MGGRFDSVDSWLALARAPALQADHLRAHPALLANPLLLLDLPAASLERLGLPAAACRWLASPRQNVLEQDRRWLERQSVQLLSWGDPGYPPLLTSIAAAPLVLFVRGSVPCLQSRQLAIVGSRQPSLVGRETAHQFAAQLAAAGLTITSGLAAGIDRAAHEGALRAGQTIPVLGTGL